MLFVGSFGHPPNVDAAVRLARAIMPAVRARVPDALLEIVGDAPPPAVRELAGDGVVVTGRVPDVGPHLERAAVVAAPLHLGGGMRVKVLESLAAGKALVATPRALAGLELDAGRHALVASTDAELSDAMAALLEDPERRRRLGAAAREWAVEHLDWEHARWTAYAELYADLLGAAAMSKPARRARWLAPGRRVRARDPAGSGPLRLHGGGDGPRRGAAPARRLAADAAAAVLDRFGWAGRSSSRSAALRLARLDADLVHTVGPMPVVPNRVDLNTVTFCHAAYDEATAGNPIKGSSSAIGWRLGQRFTLGARALVVPACRAGPGRQSPRAARRTCAASIPSVRVAVMPLGIDLRRFSPDDEDGRRFREEHGGPRTPSSPCSWTSSIAR